MQSLDELIDRIDRSEKKTVAVAQAADEEVLRAVQKAAELKIGNFHLFGDKDAINGMARAIGLDLKQGSVEVMQSSPQMAAEDAVKHVHEGKAHALMKGNIDTKSLLKAVLNKDFGLRTDRVLSHVALFEIPNREKLIFLTDSGMNIAPSLQEKVQIITNIVEVSKKAGIINPKVAVLAAVEVVNPAMPITEEAAILTQMNRRGQIGGCIVDGPLAFDNAVDLRAAKQKNIESDVAGNADILLAPTIETANTLYKSFMYFANAKVAAVISGARAPIVLTSRADTAESKVYSLALALQSRI